MLPWTLLTLALTVCVDLCFAKGVFSVHNYRHVPVNRNSATVRRVGNVYVFPYYSATRRKIHRCGYGSYKKGCCAGWMRNSVAGTCTPICESGCVHGTCVGPNQCSCEPGYTGSNCNADLNECGQEPRPCNQRCINTMGSFRCHCEQGYLLEEDGKTCIRDSRCYPGRCAYGCRKSGYRLECICPAGLRLAKDGYHCLDIDECKEGTVKCPSDQRCVNTYGNYMCLCQEGYQFRYFGGKLKCTESEDRCANSGFICDTNAKCQEGDGGSVKCVCDTGYVGNGEECSAVDIRNCARRPCYSGVSCTNVDLESNDIPYPTTGVLNLYECGPCPTGLQGNGEVCTDKNECTDGTAECHSEADCFNTDGSYRCACRDGYRGDGFTCTAIGCVPPGVLPFGFITPDPAGFEYADNAIISFECVPGYNLEGAGISTCLKGMWSADMPQCTDINECETGDAVCHEHATCSNTQGSYTCTCNLGYTGSGIVCSRLTCDVTEPFEHGIIAPLPNADREYDHGTLVSFICNQGFLQVGSFTSECVLGKWSHPFPQCVDVDECATSITNTCDQNANCINNPGSYSCVCRDGYTGDGRTCVRIDPTMCIDLPCHHNVVCTDLDSAVVLATVDVTDPTLDVIRLYKCGDCPDGYRGNGTTCVDIDECAENLDNCDANAACFNEPGTYFCSCNWDHYGDGLTCIPIDQTTCGDLPCFPGVPCTDFIRQVVLAAVDLTTPPDIITLYECGVCPPGYVGDGVNCTDIDECALSIDNCDANAQCINTPGDYNCVCNNEYYGDGFVCIPIDPTTCADDPCFRGVECQDVSLGEAVGVIDLANPVPVIRLYRCGLCPPGYRGDGVVCDDVDECDVGTHSCDVNAQCINSAGNYSCVCNKEYYGDGQVCIPIDPTRCADDPCFPGVVCDDLTRQEAVMDVDLTKPVRVIRQYRCGLCPPGYRGDGVFCDDIDECSEGTYDCHANATCINLPGGFECSCNKNFHGDGKICIPMDLSSCEDGPCFDGVECSDLDQAEVLAAIDLATASEDDVIKFYDCGDCPGGYLGDGEFCFDVNECDLGNFNCHTNATCENEIGGYTCICFAGHFGNGTHCAQLDDRSCDDDPCFAGVECIDIDPIDVDFTQPFVKLFECGECPEDYSGDGIECIKDYVPPTVNLTVVVLEKADFFENPSPDAEVSAFIADASAPQGTVRVASAITGPDGVVRLAVPHNQSIIVTAGKEFSLVNSLTTKAHLKQNNIVTITLAQFDESTVFLWRKSSSNAFEFGGQDGGAEYRVAITAGGLRVPERRRVGIDFYGVNVTIPDSMESAPEPIAAISRGDRPRGDMGGAPGENGVDLVALEVVGVMELNVYRTDNGLKPRITIPVSLSIPVAKLPPDLQVGDRLDAWYFDPDHGVWLQDGSGLIEEDANNGMLTWSYEARHFTWWAAGRPQAQQNCVNVRACLDKQCNKPVPNIRIRLTGEDYGYVTSRLTDRDGAACFSFKHTGAVTVEAVCAMERTLVISSADPAACPLGDVDIPTVHVAQQYENNTCQEVTLVLPPIAANLTCPDPGQIVVENKRADRTLKGRTYSDSVNYVCPMGYRLGPGEEYNGYRACLECGLWSGASVTCEQDEQFQRRKKRWSSSPRKR